jgi:CRP-like cAMP-binding protein
VGDPAAEHRRDLRRASARHSDAKIANALEHVPIFCECSKRELKLVAKVAKQQTVRANTTLMVEGEPGDTMLVILSGGATVTKGGRKIAQLGTGDVVGELAPLTKAPRNATVTTRTECDIAIIGRKDLYKLIDDAPGFARKLLEALANRIRDLDRKLVS